MPTTVIQSRQYRQMRAELKAHWSEINAPCALCGQATIDWQAPANQPDSFELDHRLARKPRPDLALDPANMQPSHFRCNRGKGAGNTRPTIGENTEDW
jgi:hypothetical protein